MIKSLLTMLIKRTENVKLLLFAVFLTKAMGVLLVFMFGVYLRVPFIREWVFNIFNIVFPFRISKKSIQKLLT